MDFFGRLFGKKAPMRDADRFADLIVKALRQRTPATAIAYDPETFELTYGDGNRVYLHNTYAEYEREEEANRPALIDRFADFIIHSAKPTTMNEAALDALMPLVRSRADMIANLYSLGPWPYAHSSRPFCETMLTMLAIDSESSISMVTDDQLADLGISFEEALGIATGHLAERGDHLFESVDEGIYLSTCGDAYDASLILIPDLIRDLSVNGNHVAIVAARSLLIVTGSDDLSGLDRAARFVWQDFPGNERSISLTPLELRNGKWGLLNFRPDYPQSLKNLLQYQRKWSYDSTGEGLQEALGDDLYVASVILVEQGGRAATVASWGAGVRTACPIVDAIVIQADGDFPEITRRFEDVMNVCGPFPLVEAMPYPPRYAFPGRMTSDSRRELTEMFGHYDLFAEQ
jgi:uncharacterized protein YtpQ (UPF0354 family)